MIELRYPEVQEYFEQIGMPVEESSFYLVEEAPSKGRITRNTGTYLPRNRNGYIEPVGSLNDIEETYIHEYAHGAFFENTELGTIIAQRDEEVSKEESLLFGDIRNENFRAIPNDEVEVSRKKPGASNTYEVNPQRLQNYKEARNTLERALKSSKPLIEGFSLLMEDELGEGEIDASGAEEAYIHLKKIRESNGMQGVKRFLSSPEDVKVFLNQA